jgi:hypothetical protein
MTTPRDITQLSSVSNDDFSKEMKEDLQPISLVVPKRKKPTAIKCGKVTVIYPIIYEASKLMEDEFWKTLFEELSCGKYPKSIYISNNILFSTNKKKKPFSYSLNPENKSAEEVANDLHELLLTYTNLCSDADLNTRKALVQSKNTQTTVTKWSSIKKKNLKEQYILNYANRMRKQYKLPYPLMRHLLILIHTAFNDFKTHKSEDVDFQNDQITGIEDIVYDEEYKTFINYRLFDPDYEWVDDTGTREKNYVHYHWGKYIMTMAKPV